MVARLAAMICTGLALAAAAEPAAAAEWHSLAIGQPGPGGERAFADAFNVARALRRAQPDPVGLMRDVTLGDLRAGFDALAGERNALIYYAGSLPDAGQALAARDRGFALQAVVQDLAALGVGQVVLLVENCAGQGGAAQAPQVPEAPAGVALRVLASAPEGGRCPEPGARLTERLIAAAAAGTSLDAALAGLEVAAGAPPAPDLPRMQFTRAALPVVLPSAPGPGSGAAPVREVVTIRPLAPGRALSTRAPVALAARPVATAAAAPAAGAGATDAAREAVVIFAPPPRAQTAAQPTAAGLPEPSIIVGRIEPDPAATAAPGGEGLAYRDLALRRQMREEQPEVFAALLASGTFDPPPAEIARAIQQELARMGCYRAGVDGVWGGGSRSAVGRYFEQREGVQAVSLEPVRDLYRQIIAVADVACPEVAAAPVAARSTPAAARSTATAAAPAARRTAPAATPPAAATPRIQPGARLGVFR